MTRASALTIAVSLIVACHGVAPQDVPPLVGDFPLIRYNGSALPVTIGLVATKDSIRQCPLQVASGSLRLSADGTFTVGYSTLDGCNQQPLGTTGVFGTFVQTGGNLSLRIAATDTAFQHLGVIAETYVRLIFDGAGLPTLTLDFQR